jgi:hypothetical protein
VPAPADRDHPLGACTPSPEEQALQTACSAGDTYACGMIVQAEQQKRANALAAYSNTYRAVVPQQVQVVPY